MNARRILPVLALVLFTVGVATGQGAEQPPLKVLFIGNSYTYVNDLPSLIVALADAAGGRKIETGQQLVGGCTLERHVNDKKAVEKIREQKWDVVVLQDHSLQAILRREAMFKYARVLDGEIKKQGAKTVFYLTWARQHIPQMQDGADPAASPDYAKAMYQMSGAAKSTGFDPWCQKHHDALVAGIDGAYFDLAKDLGAQVAPVGIAWKKALAADPHLVLHQPDKSHPNPTGSYLAACVFYATLFDKSPVGLPGELKKGTRVLVQVAPDTAKQLQEVAWQAAAAEALGHAGGGTSFAMSLDAAKVGELPQGWASAKTGHGPGSEWKVVKDTDGKKVLAQTSGEGPNRLFNLCVAENTRFTDVDLAVAFKAVTGKLDQGGGLVWRYRDADNYYIARMNPLEDNYRVYKVLAGKRTQLASVDVKIPKGEWHFLRVTHSGDHIQCFLDATLRLDVKDATFKEPGKIGLWTKADAQTHFADLQAKERR